ncbi:MAG TPA: iron-containing alcohol dehydrogenase, partial [Thermomicrobiales bacterium]|nr:iron-containing alcohol dehydrogenase [Thermomicrobiales bacterium]
MATESIFTMDSSSIKFGFGATAEIGYEMARLGATRVMVVTDPNLRDGDAVGQTLASLKAEGIDAVLFDKTRVEPT